MLNGIFFLLVHGILLASPPPCTSSNDCGADAYCKRAIGVCPGDGPDDTDASKPGVCTPRKREDDKPLLPANFDMVCSCDYETLFNEAHAALNGVNILHTGKCTVKERLDHGNPERFIGRSREEVAKQMIEKDAGRTYDASGVCFSNEHCLEGEFCQKHGKWACIAPHHGRCVLKGGFGITEPIPGGVCGCDGTIYPIPIDPSRHGINIDESRSRCTPSR